MRQNASLMCRNPGEIPHDNCRYRIVLLSCAVYLSSLIFAIQMLGRITSAEAATGSVSLILAGYGHLSVGWLAAPDLYALHFIVGMFIPRIIIRREAGR